MLRRIVRAALRNLLTDDTSSIQDEKEVVPTTNSSDVVSSEPPRETELQKYKRKADAYFSKIESIMLERDTWKTMFYEQGNGHHSAQVLLEVKLMETRELLGRAIDIVNKYRVTVGEPPLETPFKELTDPPIGSSKEFEELIARLNRGIPIPVDHLKERDAICVS